MAVLTIIQTSEIDLRHKADKVQNFDKSIRTLLGDMAETLASAGGLGLAAIQVGVPMRIFVVRRGTEYIKFVNPTISGAEGRQDSPEACLSLPGVYGMVRRPARVIVDALDENGKPFRLEATGRLAGALSHEYDHLDGILFTDKAYMVRRFHVAAPSSPGTVKRIQ
jgi:peptide deformylase